MELSGSTGSAPDQFVRILQTAARPFRGGDNFRRANASVLVGVNQRKRLGVEFQADRRARERDPELLVELVERQQVGATVEPDLVESARAKEFPLMK